MTHTRDRQSKTGSDGDRTAIWLSVVRTENALMLDMCWVLSSREPEHGKWDQGLVTGGF